jgi:hypothetical protein
MGFLVKKRRENCRDIAPDCAMEMDNRAARKT